jgi:hypothetical protein
MANYSSRSEWREIWGLQTCSVHSDIFEDKMNRNSEMKNLLLKITIKVVKMILAIEEK